MKREQRKKKYFTNEIIKVLILDFNELTNVFSIFGRLRNTQFYISDKIVYVN